MVGFNSSGTGGSIPGDEVAWGGADAEMGRPTPFLYLQTRRRRGVLSGRRKGKSNIEGKEAGRTGYWPERAAAWTRGATWVHQGELHLLPWRCCWLKNKRGIEKFRKET